MKKVEVKSVGVPFEECERILAAAKERGKDAIIYKAITRDRKPVSVTNIHGAGHEGEFSLVLTVEDPEKAERPKKAEPETVESREDEAAGKPEEEPECRGDDDDGFGGDVMDRLIDVLGLAIFMAGIINEGPYREYTRGKIRDLMNLMLKNGLGGMFMKASSAALDHFLASSKQTEKEDKE